MSDDQRDAELEAGLSGRGTREPATDRPGDDVGADLAQIRSRLEVLEQRLDALHDRLGVGQGSLLEQLQDNLADVASGEVVGSLWEEVRELRAVAGGPGGGPDEVVRESLDALRAEVEGIGAALAARTEPTADPAVAGMREDLATLRAELTEGLVVEPSNALLDQVAALRDFVASELDRLHQVVAGRAAGAVDDDAVELLREEIRAAGGVSDQVVESLRDELKALRRRIAVKASEKVLDDEQIDQIAAAVAARLASE